VPLLRRRGFTLVELLIALTLLSLVSAGLWRVLDVTRETYLLHAQRVELRRNLRAGAVILPAELRELDARDSDITAMSGTSIRIRATRQLAFLCVLPEYRTDGSVALTVRRDPMLGLRQSFTVGDSALLYHEGDPSTRQDDRWLAARIRAAADETCPDANRPHSGYRLSLELPWTSEGLPDVRGVTRGAPLRGFESVAYTLYRSPTDTLWYLGQQAQDEPIQPLLGPLTGSDGVTFGYYDSAGAPTAAPVNVAQIEIRIRGRTALPVRRPGARRAAYEADSLVTWVALRNNPRPSRRP